MLREAGVHIAEGVGDMVGAMQAALKDPRRSFAPARLTQTGAGRS
jgi:hypothetical protein